jgi:hypothetical protein
MWGFQAAGRSQRDRQGRRAARARSPPPSASGTTRRPGPGARARATSPRAERAPCDRPRHLSALALLAAAEDRLRRARPPLGRRAPDRWRRPRAAAGPALVCTVTRNGPSRPDVGHRPCTYDVSRPGRRGGPAAAAASRCRCSTPRPGVRAGHRDQRHPRPSAVQPAPACLAPAATSSGSSHVPFFGRRVMECRGVGAGELPTGRVAPRGAGPSVRCDELGETRRAARRRRNGIPAGRGIGFVGRRVRRRRAGGLGRSADVDVVNGDAVLRLTTDWRAIRSTCRLPLGGCACPGPAGAAPSPRLHQVHADECCRSSWAPMHLSTSQVAPGSCRTVRPHCRSARQRRPAACFTELDCPHRARGALLLECLRGRCASRHRRAGDARSRCALDASAYAGHDGYPRVVSGAGPACWCCATADGRRSCRTGGTPSRVREVRTPHRGRPAVPWGVDPGRRGHDRPLPRYASSERGTRRCRRCCRVRSLRLGFRRSRPSPGEPRAGR